MTKIEALSDIDKALMFIRREIEVQHVINGGEHDTCLREYRRVETLLMKLKREEENQ